MFPLGNTNCLGIRLNIKNTAGIWYFLGNINCWGMCLNIRILRVFGGPRKYQLLGYVPEYTNTPGIWYFPFGNTNCWGMCLNIRIPRVFGISNSEIPIVRGMCLIIRIPRVFGISYSEIPIVRGMCLNIPKLRVSGNIRILRVFGNRFVIPIPLWISHNIPRGNPLAHHGIPMGHPRAFPSATFG